MRFQLESSTLSQVIKAGFAGTFALAILTACSDKLSGPTELQPFDVEEELVPDSLKNPPGAYMTSATPMGFVKAPLMSSVLVSPSAASASVPSGGYKVFAVPFAPEEKPTENRGPLCDDACVMEHVPLGFEFVFFGNPYTELNISPNGFVAFGQKPGHGCCRGGAIPSDDITNNIIALAWSDWNPLKVSNGIMWETRGEAPNRRFILQFTNVPEGAVLVGAGRLTAQLILHEGSNEIDIYITQLSTFRSDHIITQGIENSTGTAAAFVEGRVRNFYKLTNDGVRFSPPQNQRPVLSVPADISLDLEIGSCSANVDVGSATATDDEEGFEISSERSDLLQLDEPYPAGVTTIVWTVRDAGGLAASANQLITLKDKEAPSVVAPADLSADNDPGLGSAIVDAGVPAAEDKCGEVASVEGVRSDAAALSAPYPVGVTKISWTAVDVSGNSAVAVQTITVRDVEAPVFSSLSDILVDATSRAGAVVNFATPAGDNVGVHSISCSRASGSVFPVGVNPVTCVAKDAAGNQSSASFVVTVRGAAEQLHDLVDYVGELNLSGGVGTPMLNQLQSALAAIDKPDHVSCKKLEDFIKAATSSKARAEVSAPELEALLAQARRIQSVLGC